MRRVTKPYVCHRLVLNKANAPKAYEACKEFIRRYDTQGMELKMMQFERKCPLKL